MEYNTKEFGDNIHICLSSRPHTHYGSHTSNKHVLLQLDVNMLDINIVLSLATNKRFTSLG